MTCDPFDVAGAMTLYGDVAQDASHLWWAVGYNVIAFPLAAGMFYPSSSARRSRHWRCRAVRHWSRSRPASQADEVATSLGCCQRNTATSRRCWGNLTNRRRGQRAALRSFVGGREWRRFSSREQSSQVPAQNRPERARIQVASEDARESYNCTDDSVDIVRRCLADFGDPRCPRV